MPIFFYASRIRARSVAAIVLTIVLHLALMVVVHDEMMPHVPDGMSLPYDESAALDVRFVDRLHPVPPARDTTPSPGELPQAIHRHATKKLAEAANVGGKPADVAGQAVPSTDREDAAESRAEAVHDTASFTPPPVTGDPAVMLHRNPVTYTATRFEKAWAPRDENLGNQALRRASEATTLKKTIDLGHGLRMHCAIGVLAGGCGFGDAPSKAATKDGDARLSMAPARPLDGAPNRNEAECIAAYRADQRVMEGCPTDTPLKAMDQENAERSRRTGE